MSELSLEENFLPVLYRLEKNNNEEERVTERIKINHAEFTIGRSDQVSLPILNVSISRQQCTIKKTGNNWSIIDQSKFGTKLNNALLTRETLLQDGDTIELDATGIFKYKFYLISQPCSSPATKRLKLDPQVTGLDVDQNYHDRFSAMQSKISAAKLEQSYIQEEKINLQNAYQQKINELEHKFVLEREKMENRANDGEAQHKVLAKEREEMEVRLQAEKDEIKVKFEEEKETLQLKVEEQKQVEEKLKEENEKLQAMIETERREFEQQLAEERRQLEQSTEEAKRKADEEKAKLERELTERLDKLKEQQEIEKTKFNEELEKGTLDKQKLEEEHQKVMEQLKEQESAAAHQLNEKQMLEKRLQEMEEALREKEEQQRALSEELAKKEEEKKQELESLRAQQEVENQRIREDMKVQEQKMRSSLDSEISKLESDKLKLEADMRKEMNAESLESKHQYEAELEKVKKQLGLMESKKQVLEQELASNNQEKEKITENCLQAKQKVLEDFGDMMQSELQCQICSELFIIATTLNCTHTFCKLCISDWKRKKTKAVADCPVCRAPIVSENRSIVLDNFIDKMVESLTDDLKEQRKQLLIERGARPGPSTAVASTSNAPPQVHQQQPPVQRNQYLVLNQALTAAIQQAQQTNNRVTVNLPPGQGIQIRGVAPQNVPQGIGAARQRGGRSNLRGGGGGGARRHAQGPAPPQPAPTLVRVLPPAPRPQLPAPRPQLPAPRPQLPAPRPAVPTATVPAPQRQAAPAQQPRPTEVQILNQRQGSSSVQTPAYVPSDSDSDNSDEIIVPGVQNTGYGGFGRCFSCGMKGHWAPGCPFGSRK